MEKQDKDEMELMELQPTYTQLKYGRSDPKDIPMYYKPVPLQKHLDLIHHKTALDKPKGKIEKPNKKVEGAKSVFKEFSLFDARLK